MQQKLDIVNSALAKVGEPLINALPSDNQSLGKAADLCKQRINHIMDRVVLYHPWRCARATLSGMAPDGNAPPKPWQYQYSIPLTCLHVISVFGPEGRDNEPYLIEGSKIYCNAPSIQLQYLRSLVDERVPEDLAELMAWELAKDITPSLSGKDIQVIAQEHEKALIRAKSREMRQERHFYGQPETSSWVQIRAS